MLQCFPAWIGANSFLLFGTRSNSRRKERGKPMEAKLRTEAIEYLKHACNTSFTQEETAETIVPDAYPDMQTIVDVEGNITLRSKTAEAGRVSLNGAIAASVVYLPEGEERLRKLELTIPFTAGCDASDVTDDTKICVMATLIGIDARMLNSRKALVRAEILVEIQGYGDSVLDYAAEIEDAAEAGLQIRREEVEVSFVSQVREKTFAISDEFHLPAGLPPLGEILKSQVRLSTDDVKNVGNKLIFKGTAAIHAMYAAQQTGEPHTVEFAATFSQIMEMEGEADEGAYEIALMLTNVYLESGTSEGGTMAVELHLVAQAVEVRRHVLPYISDAYSTRFSLETGRMEHQLESMEPPQELGAEVRESVELPVGMVRVVDYSVRTGKVNVGQEGGRLQLKSAVNVSAIYLTEEGGLTALNRRFEVAAEMDIMPHMAYTATIRAGESAQIIPGADGAEIRVPVQFMVRPCRKMRFAALNALRWDEEHPRDLASLPSVVVFSAEGGESLWHLAKRYCSTEALIVGANGIGEDAVPYPGQMFIIPKAR